MNMKMSNSENRLRATQFLLTITALTCISRICPRTNAEATQQPPRELLRGFKAKPDPSTTSFQPLLRDDTGNMSFGFLRTNKTLLSLAVVHVPSSEPLWVADPTRTLLWSDRTELVFNGSLVIRDPKSRVEWSTGKQNGDKVSLLSSSNLQITQTGGGEVLWQSFESPGNTLVEGQNFSEAMSLVSSNGLYSMRLGGDFWGLYAQFGESRSQMYLKHTALQAKARIVEGNGSLVLRVDPNGYFVMYQTGTDPPVDLLPFSSFNSHVDGPLIARLEPDGNLRAYFWSGSKWVLSFEAISEVCELPSPCGSYGLCKSGSGCSCLNNRTEECLPRGVKSSGDFCGVGKNDFSVVRRRGVDLPFKELMRSETAASLKECEGICAKNCSCWGSVYNNNTGFCYTLDYPIQTVLSVGDESKSGYFKLREGVGRDRVGVLFRAAGICVLVGVILVFSVFVGVLVYKAWKRKRQGSMKGLFEEETGGVSPGPYKDLGSASFRSIEMCSRYIDHR